MNVFQNVSISSLTTMRIGGDAKYVVEITKIADIEEAYNFAKLHNSPAFVLGMGANTLGLDEGFDGVILLNKLKGMQILSNTPDQLIIKVMSGEIWDDFVAKTTELGFTGVEALSSIPSTVGAAPVQNIGAYGQEVSDSITSVEVFDTKTGEITELTHEACRFSYRRSIFNREAKNRYFIISVTFKLKNGEMTPPFYNSVTKFIEQHQISDFSPTSIRRIVAEIRAEKLPDPKTTPSAGSFFKNVYLSNTEADIAEAKGIPVYRSKTENKVNSGWLIEQCGLKGKNLHGFRVSDKAALVLINENANKYAELAAARDEIISAVKEKFDYTLEQEPVELKNG